MKDSRRSLSIYTEILFLHVVKHNLFYFVLFCFVLFFYLPFFYEYSQFTGQKEKEEAISLLPFYIFHPLHRHLDIIWVIAVEI